MILQNPETGEKLRIKRLSPLRWELQKQGYRDVTPPRTPAQIETTDRWLARGRLELARTNIQAVIRDQKFYQFTADELRFLQKAEEAVYAKCNNFPMSKETHKRLRKQALSNTDENTP